MKLELRVGGQVVVIEAEGPVSVSVREDAAPPPVLLFPAAEGGLFEKLVALRKKLASEQGVPPYVIFQDKTLREMAEARPADLPAFALIAGVGQAKLEKYGARFLEVIGA